MLVVQDISLSRENHIKHIFLIVFKDPYYSPFLWEKHIHHIQKFLHENIRSLAKNQLHNRIFVITCWFDVNQ